MCQEFLAESVFNMDESREGCPAQPAPKTNWEGLSGLVPWHDLGNPL